MMAPGSGYFPNTKHLGANWFQNDPTTVDGRNPEPVDMVNIPLLTGFYTSQESLPSTVWDFCKGDLIDGFDSMVKSSPLNKPSFGRIQWLSF